MKTFKTLIVAVAFLGSAGAALAEGCNYGTAAYSAKPTQTAQNASTPADGQQTAQQ